MPKRKPNLIKEFGKLDWPDLRVNKKSISIKDNKATKPLLSIKKNIAELSFYKYDPKSKSYLVMSELATLQFETAFDWQQLFTKWDSGYRLKLLYIIKQLLLIPKSINRIIITSKVVKNGISFYKNTAVINYEKYNDALLDSIQINTKVQRHKGFIQRYLTNSAIEKYSGKIVQRKTLIQKGDINFTIQRLNIPTKRSPKDIKPYLDNSDIQSVEKLSMLLLKHNLFSEDYIRKLNDLFIRENLTEIIELGSRILSLGSSDLKTKVAQQIIKDVTKSNASITQLENLWQKYFEKYLLYLIFSYKEIFPKVELTDIQEDKKYPDFIGINHYYGVDVIEIKTHLAHVLTSDPSHKNFAFSLEMSKAIIQTMNYLDAVIHTQFKKNEDKEKITNSTHEENIYRPRGIIVISSTDRLVSSMKQGDRDTIIRDFTKLRNSVQNIEILTFDEILGIAKDYLDNVISTKKEPDEELRA